MATHPFIAHNDFPTQGSWLGRRVEVAFNYDTAHTVGGVIVREDSVPPGVMIIRLDDDRYVLSTECQYALVPKERGPRG